MYSGVRKRSIYGSNEHVSGTRPGLGMQLGLEMGIKPDYTNHKLEYDYIKVWPEIISN